MVFRSGAFWLMNNNEAVPLQHYIGNSAERWRLLILEPGQ